MKIDALQDKIVTLLAAAFPSDLVVAAPSTKVSAGETTGNNSRKKVEERMETALATRGLCWAVSPLLNGRGSGGGGTSAAVRCYVKALLRTNPEVNGNGTTGAGIEPVAAIRTAITAVLAFRENGNKKFSISEDEDCLELVEDAKDAGLLCWRLTFTYVVQV